MSEQHGASKSESADMIMLLIITGKTRLQEEIHRKQLQYNAPSHPDHLQYGSGAHPDLTRQLYVGLLLLLQQVHGTRKVLSKRFYLSSWIFQLHTQQGVPCFSAILISLEAQVQEWCST